MGVTIGPPAVDEQIRAALAMGVDHAIRIDDSRALDPYAVARILGAVVKREAPYVVIMGKQAVDDDSNQVGQMLAGLLGWPQATFVSKIEFLDSNRRARCTRETDAGLEVVEVDLPAIITTDLRLNEPRYVSLPGLMVTHSSRLTGRLPAAAGSTRACLAPTGLTKRTRAIPKITSGTDGGSPGRVIGASYIIERAPVRPASLGATAKS